MELDANDEYTAMFQETWPKVLQRLRIWPSDDVHRADRVVAIRNAGC